MIYDFQFSMKMYIDAYDSCLIDFAYLKIAKFELTFWCVLQSLTTAHGIFFGKLPQLV